ncbi:MAG: Flp family type IVb pilin, partial [Chloroflexi bacterium]|nr:Flp family type IVb pilin [Chloroflexota bacterium]
GGWGYPAASAAGSGTEAGPMSSQRRKSSRVSTQQRTMRSGQRRNAEAGQSMVEYSIVAALIAVVAMAAVQALGGGVSNVFTNILTRISGIGS